MIKVQNLTKYFGKKQVLNNLSFTVNDDEIFGLIGQNGVGKTTVLRILSTLLKPTFGTAIINGYDIIKDPLSVRKIIGFLPEESGLYDRLTPKEILQYFGSFHNLNGNKLQDRIDFLLSSLELNELANVRSSVLSKGTKQKVAVLRAIIHDPEILLLDEPTENLDVLSQVTIKKYMLNNKNRGAIIISSHDMHQIDQLCTKVGIIVNGSIIVEETVENLKEEYGEKDLEEIYIRVIKENQ